MSIIEELAAARPSKTPKILLLDVERTPDLGRFYDMWKQGNIIATEEDWYLLSAAWQWFDRKQIHFIGVNDAPDWQPGSTDDRHVVAKLHELMDEADVVMAYNGMSFDIKVVQSRFLVHRMLPTSRFQALDPLRILRKHFQFTSNSLREICRVLDVDTPKGDSGGYGTWRGCMDGDEKAWRKMRRYNKSDVAALRAVYERLVPWMNRPAPNQQVNLAHWAPTVVDPESGERLRACPACGLSGAMRLSGTPHRTAVSQFQVWVCDPAEGGCGADSRARYAKRPSDGGVRLR